MPLGEFTVSGNQILDAAGNKIRLTGTNWGGAEHAGLVPVGLWARNYKSMMDQMKQLGFNCIRFPYSDEAVVSTMRQNVSINYGLNPDLQNLTPLQVWDKLIDYANQIGLFVFFDHHRTWAGNNTESGTMRAGLWYDKNGVWTEDKVIANWKTIAARYRDRPNIIGADLHNEPHSARFTTGNNGMTWGQGGEDWAAAAERIGNAVLSIAPHWLIIVEGVETVAGTWQGSWGDFWIWGGNLIGARPGRRPITLNVPNKLVYSAHEYMFGYAQHVQNAANFPNNLPALWNEIWGWNYTKQFGNSPIAPVLIGEFGGWMSDAKERGWMQKLQQYMAGDFNNDGSSDLTNGDLGVHWTHWNWGPLSGDTGGVLMDDWQTVNQAVYGSIKDYLWRGTIVGGAGNGSTVPTDPPPPVTPVNTFTGRHRPVRMTTGTSYGIAYTCPDGYRAVITGVQAVNVTAGNIKVSAQWTDASASNAITRLGVDVVIKPKDADNLEFGWKSLVTGQFVLEAGDTIQFKSDTAGAANINIALVEIALA